MLHAVNRRFAHLQRLPHWGHWPHWGQWPPTSVTRSLTSLRSVTTDLNEVGGQILKFYLSQILYAAFTNDSLYGLEHSHLGAHISSIYCGAPTYADNMSLISHSEHVLQEMLNIVSGYAFKWQYSINPSKSQIIMFCNWPSLHPKNPSWSVCRNEIPVSDTAKHLGIYYPLLPLPLPELLRGLLPPGVPFMPSPPLVPVIHVSILFPSTLQSNIPSHSYFRIGHLVSHKYWVINDGEVPGQDIEDHSWPPRTYFNCRHSLSSGHSSYSLYCSG